MSRTPSGRLYLHQINCKRLHFRNALDEVTNSSFFPVLVQEVFGVMLEEALTQCEKLFYIDGHFSPYYGERNVPYGYDTKRKRGYPGRNLVFIHDETGKNVIFFESPRRATSLFSGST